jgi:hypothetical protein
MNLRHAAALALIGWYLIVPPYLAPFNYRDLWAPVSQWKIVQGFDTPTGCEGYLQEMKEDPAALHGEYAVAPKFKMQGLTKMGGMGIGLFALKYGRCIFVDDPRLDQN